LDVQKFANENRGCRYILIVICAFSKVLFTAPLQDKTGASLVKAFGQILRKNQRKPEMLQVDQGSEFLNAKFRKLMKEQKIKMFHTFSNLKAVIVERVIRTLRTRIERYFTHTGRNKFIDALPYFTSSYNATFHSSIRMAPRDVNKENELQVWLNLYGDLADDMVHTRLKPIFKVNDLVRITRQKLLFEKGYKINWSEEIFRITKVRDTRPITYTLEDLTGEDITGSFLEPELQLTFAPQGKKTLAVKVIPQKQAKVVRKKQSKEIPLPVRRSSRLKPKS
jgi:hypothetical protein